jgi:hypothetical protein
MVNESLCFEVFICLNVAADYTCVLHDPKRGMGKIRSVVTKFWSENLKVRNQFGRTRRKSENNNTVDIKEVNRVVRT